MGKYTSEKYQEGYKRGLYEGALFQCKYMINEIKTDIKNTTDKETIKELKIALKIIETYHDIELKNCKDNGYQTEFEYALDRGV